MHGVLHCDFINYNINKIFGDFKLADFSCGLFLENNHSLVFRSVFMISEKEEVVY